MYCCHKTAIRFKYILAGVWDSLNMLRRLWLSPTTHQD